MQSIAIAVVIVVAAIASAAIWYLTRPVEAEDIKIGVCLPLSPPGAYVVGGKMKSAFQLAIDQLNAKGGLLGKNVTAIYEDTQASPEKATAAATKLITQDHVAFIVGEAHSSPARAISEVCHKYNVIFIATDVWADDITGTHYPTIFRIAPYNSYMFIGYLDAFKQFGYKNVVALAETTDWGIAVDNYFKTALPAIGISYYSHTVDVASTDMTAELTEFASRTPKPDLFLALQTECFLPTKQAFEVGLSPTAQIFAMATKPAFPEIWTAVGNKATGLIFVNVYHPKAVTSQVGMEFNAAFKAKTGFDADGEIVECMDTILALTDAVKKAGTINTNDVIQALETVNVQGSRGPVSFTTNLTFNNAQWHQYMSPLYIIQYTENNQLYNDAEIVYPLTSNTTAYVPQKNFFP
jgi:branched-chain amino acid transport system substrate-binding protein